MLRPRLIPVLLVRNKGLVKTIGFEDGKYVGDPLNAVRLFNEKEVDELVVLDIDASVNRQEPNYRLIASLAAECRMPLCYGGGVKNLDQVKKIVTLGVEKVAISSAAIDEPSFLSRCADSVGQQSVVAVVDVKRSRWRKRYEVYTHNGTRKTGENLEELARKLVAAGAGEVVVNSIDNDGAMKGI
jgi:cyclase